jgi:hypothetical protein
MASPNAGSAVAGATYWDHIIAINERQLSGCSARMFPTITKTVPILDWGREHRAAELPPSPPVAYALILDSEGCTIVTFGRPDPDARAAQVRLDHLRPYP